jgi:hypothetical protein
MEKADGAGGYAGTTWWNATVPEMWQALAGHEKSDAHFQVQSGWQSTYNAIINHKIRVEQYREKLIKAWPPEKSAAAAIYVQRLDQLIEHLQDTYDAATANHDAFKNASDAVSSSRGEIQRIYEQYMANQASLADYAAAKEKFGASGASDYLQPEVTPEHQLRLQRQAARLMVGLSSELADATTRLAAPKPYEPNRKVMDDQDLDTGTGGWIPPPIGSGAEVTSVRDNASAGTPRPATSDVANHPISDPANRPATFRPQPGLVLDGATPLHPAPTAPTVPSAPVNPATGGGFNPSAPPPAGPLAPRPAPSGTEFGPGAGRSPGNRPPSSGGVPRPAPGGIGAMPGVIGGTSGAFGPPGAGGRPGQGVNPVGGVIGAPATSGTRGAQPGMPGAGVGPMAGRGAGERRPDGEAQRWNPDSPWGTAEGVDPILSPRPERQIDPGPAIGLDR